MTEIATEQNRTNGVAAPSEKGDVQAGNPQPFNADTRSVDFSIPALPGSKIWRLAVDTSQAAPDDLYEAGTQSSMQGQVSFWLEPRSSAILLTDG
jgi:hypothetical protein